LITWTGSFSESVQTQFSSITQNIDNIELSVGSLNSVTGSYSSSIAAINIETGSINLNVTQLQTFSGSLSGSKMVSLINIDPSGVQIQGNHIQISSSTFWLGGDDQYISGSNGNILISASNFNLNTTKLAIDSDKEFIRLGTATGDMHTSSLAGSGFYTSGSGQTRIGGETEYIL